MADFHIDEDVLRKLAPLLRAMGHAASTALDLGLKRAGDEEHILAATQANRIFVTHNEDDFLLLHRAWLLWSQFWHVTTPHSGILILEQKDAQILAPEIDRLVTNLQSKGQSLANRLYKWESRTGWVEA